MRTAIYEASGFTGGFVVAEAQRRGMTPVLVGRDETRLRASAAAAAAHDAELRIAPLHEPERLAAAFSDCQAVINCAGPFTTCGEPVVRAALAAGCHYLDTSGEGHYISQVLEGFDADARRTGVAVIPGMADDGGPGDLIARLTAARVAPVENLLIADLRLPSVVSRGTARSMVAVHAQGGPSHPGVGLHTGPPVPRTLTPPDAADVPVTPFLLPGIATIPRHTSARRIDSVIRSDVAAAFHSLTPEIVGQLPETVDEETRHAARWLMLAEATGSHGRTAQGWVAGTDSYLLTAVIAVEGAHRLLTGTSTGQAGALAPAQAFDPAHFLDSLLPHGVTWQVTDTTE